MNIKKNILKKTIKYRLSYSGMKETDILYKNIIINKLDSLNYTELKLLSNLFNEISDAEIFKWITKKIIISNKYTNLINKITYE